MTVKQSYYALRIAPQREFIAEQLLTQDGFSIYLPLEVKWRRLSRHIRKCGWLKVPLIPSYIFARVGDEYELDAIRNSGWSFLRGIVGLPPWDSPYAIPDEQIEFIRSVEAEKCQIPAPKIDWTPNRGEWVRLINRGHAASEERIQVERIIGKKAKAFLGVLRGRSVVLKTRDVEPVA